MLINNVRYCCCRSIVLTNIVVYVTIDGRMIKWIHQSLTLSIVAVIMYCIELLILLSTSIVVGAIIT